MRSAGLRVKKEIEGPPERSCPILLRQTSFLALDEPIKFPSNSDQLVEGMHKARFGGIEERGAAVTKSGMNMYDELLLKAKTEYACATNASLDEIMTRTFRTFPDDWNVLRRKKLVFFTYKYDSAVSTPTDHQHLTIEELLDLRVLKAVPITYEDFLPFSAAGIFQSNLQSKQAQIRTKAPSPDDGGFEATLRCCLLVSDTLYRQVESNSLRECEKKLGLPRYILE